MAWASLCEIVKAILPQNRQGNQGIFQFRKSIQLGAACMQLKREKEPYGMPPAGKNLTKHIIFEYANLLRKAKSRIECNPIL